MPRAAVILLSGGLDSAVCLACARRDGFRPLALSFDYGQRHRHELAAAARVARALNVSEHRTIALDLRAVGGSALTAAIDVPKHALGKGEAIPVTYVPARNMTFLSLAVGYAEVAGAADIYIGVNALDYSGYPDCRPEFIESFERTARLATKAGARGGGFNVRAPLVRMSKGEIIRLGLSLGVDFSLTHSCYDPAVRNGETLACGACDSCLLRRRGFEEAGVPDPAGYAL
ncbi:MAG TPA: 7-cyano-7-deazaguanine synthase QueC [Phycisphaerales bacterium]|nr:7-cyano-7-deazaguanine synthase QueC [Phycisphaerales bacterium]